MVRLQGHLPCPTPLSESPTREFEYTHHQISFNRRRSHTTLRNYFHDDKLNTEFHTLEPFTTHLNILFQILNTSSHHQCLSSTRYQTYTYKYCSYTIITKSNLDISKIFCLKNRDKMKKDLET